LQAEVFVFEHEASEVKHVVATLAHFESELQRTELERRRETDEATLAIRNAILEQERAVDAETRATSNAAYIVRLREELDERDQSHSQGECQLIMSNQRAPRPGEHYDLRHAQGSLSMALPELHCARSDIEELTPALLSRQADCNRFESVASFVGCDVVANREPDDASVFAHDSVVIGRRSIAPQPEHEKRTTALHTVDSIKQICQNEPLEQVASQRELIGQIGSQEALCIARSELQDTHSQIRELTVALHSRHEDRDAHLELREARAQITMLGDMLQSTEQHCREEAERASASASGAVVASLTSEHSRADIEKRHPAGDAEKQTCLVTAGAESHDRQPVIDRLGVPSLAGKLPAGHQQSMNDSADTESTDSPETIGVAEELQDARLGEQRAWDAFRGEAAACARLRQHLSEAAKGFAMLEDECWSEMEYEQNEATEELRTELFQARLELRACGYGG
jgi:hypothetical protein